MATLGKLNVMLTANSSLLTQGFRTASRTARAFGGAITGLAQRMVSLQGAALAAVGVGGLGYLVKQQFEAIDATAKLADRLGVSTEELQGLRHAAELTGTSFETAGKGLLILLRRIDEGERGVGEGARVLDEMGLSAERLAQMTVAESFGEIADEINKLPTVAKKTAAAYALMGRSGADMLNLFAQGSAGIAEMIAEADRLGLSFSRVDAAKVEAANDSMLRVKHMLTGLAQVVTVELAPYVSALAEKFVLMGTSGEGAAIKIRGGFESLISTIAQLADAVWGVQFAWESVAATVRGLGWAAAETVALMSKTAKAITGVGWNPADEAHLERMREGFDASMDRVYAFLGQEPASDIAARGLADIKEKAQLAAEQAARIPEALAEIPGEIEEAASATETYLDKLQDQVDMFGLGAREVELFKLEAAGLDDPSRARIADLYAELDALEAREEARTAGEKVFQDTRTDLEVQNAEITRLGELLQAGALDWDTYKRAVLATGDSIANLSRLTTIGVEVGTAEAYSALQAGWSQQIEVNTTDREQLTEARRSSRYLASILAELETGGADSVRVA